MSNIVVIECKSVFKHEEESALAEAFTDKWIELINWYERVN